MAPIGLLQNNLLTLFWCLSSYVHLLVHVSTIELLDDLALLDGGVNNPLHLLWEHSTVKHYGHLATVSWEIQHVASVGVTSNMRNETCLDMTKTFSLEDPFKFLLQQWRK